ncbi:hypothetical protein [Proteus terrae]|uniref:hypothetical protein n=1 Tax=Proteus terrae TaxID=1574161 RepID=UPI00298BFE56|nr:hypothetical protein [Proteus terrae]WPD00684.1 hypothetical protein R5P25_09285 [Proteus terrae]
MCNFKEHDFICQNIKESGKSNFSVITSSIAMCILFVFLTFSLAFLAPFLVTQIFGSGAGRYATPAMVTGVIAFSLVKVFDYLSERKRVHNKKNKIKLLFAQYGLDVTTPMCFIVGFVGEPTWLYVAVGIVSSVLMGILYFRRLIDIN